MRKAGNAILILFNRVQRSSGRGAHAMAAQESAHHRGRCRLRGCSESPAECRLVNAGAVAVEWDRLVLGSCCRRHAYAESGEGDNEKFSHICLLMDLPLMSERSPSFRQFDEPVAATVPMDVRIVIEYQACTRRQADILSSRFVCNPRHRRLKWAVPRAFQARYIDAKAEICQPASEI